jgi:predicted DsbA family dithiol-disulfide isomerase
VTDGPLPPPVGPGVIRVHSDIGCPWSHVLVHRLGRLRDELGVHGELRLEHRALPLELLNGRATPLDVLEAEIETLAEVEPDAGWSRFAGQASDYPGSTVAALAAVQAAQDPDVGHAAELDRALRRAFFAEWRNLAIHPIVLEVAAGVDGLDVGRLDAELRTGRPLAEVWRQLDEFRSAGLRGSPELVLSDGTTVHNPGFEFHWEDGDPGAGRRLVIDRDDPDELRTIVEGALQSMRFD